MCGRRGASGQSEHGQAAREGLRTLGTEAADLAERLEQGLLMSSAIEQEVSFLAGLTIGLELGRG